MSLRVLHVVESLRPSPGSVMVCLPGLFRVLGARQVQCHVTDSGEDVADVDVVHIHGWGFEAARAVARRAQRTGTPYLISPYGALAGDRSRTGLWQRMRNAFTEKPGLRGAAGLIALNEDEGTGLRHSGLHDSIHVLPLGLSLADYDGTAPGRTGAQTRIVLVLGSLHPQGGCVALLKAMAELGTSADGWSVVLASRTDDPWRGTLEAAVRRKGGAERVRLAVVDDVAGQRQLLGSAAMVAAPNLQVAPPVSIMQAAASGRACLATTCVVPGGLNGALRVCPPRRDDLREALREVFGMTDSTRSAMGRAALVAARGTLDWPILADRYLDLYKTVGRVSS